MKNKNIFIAKKSGQFLSGWPHYYCLFWSSLYLSPFLPSSFSFLMDQKKNFRRNDSAKEWVMKGPRRIFNPAAFTILLLFVLTSSRNIKTSTLFNNNGGKRRKKITFFNHNILVNDGKKGANRKLRSGKMTDLLFYLFGSLLSFHPLFREPIPFPSLFSIWSQFLIEKKLLFFSEPLFAAYFFRSGK